MTGVIYCRVSSKEQIEGTSLESQEVACREFARSRNIHVEKVFIEQGESAKCVDRTQLVELIDFCRNHKGNVDAVLVWKLDRFARNVSDHFSVKAVLGKYGVRIVSVTEPINDNAEGKLMETILAGFAEFDNSIRAMRTVQGMRRKIQEGIFPWRAPLGYRSSVLADEKKTRPDVPDEPAFSILRRAFKEFATGGYTKAEIGRLMNRWGLPAIRGKPVAAQWLDKLFSNPFYAGILVDPWSGEEHAGKHIPLLTRTEFARVQQVITRRSRSVVHHVERVEFPLRGVVRCAACNHTLTSAFSRGRSNSYPYYLCSQKQCVKRGKSLPAEPIHDEFMSYLDELAPRPNLIGELARRIAKFAAEEDQALAKQREHKRKTVAKLEAEIGELIRMRAQHLVNDEEFVVQKKRLTDQRMALEAKPAQRMDLARVHADLRSIAEPLAELRTTRASLEPRFRLRFDHLILPGGFTVGKIRTAALGRLFYVFRTFSTMKSGVVALTCESSNPLIAEISEFAEVIGSLGCAPEELPAAV